MPVITASTNLLVSFIPYLLRQKILRKYSAYCSTNLILPSNSVPFSFFLRLCSAWPWAFAGGLYACHSVSFVSLAALFLLANRKKVPGMFAGLGKGRIFAPVIKNTGLWCNGNTTDSGPVFPGSSPGSPTKRMRETHPFLLCLPPCGSAAGRQTAWRGSVQMEPEALPQDKRFCLFEAHLYACRLNPGCRFALPWVTAAWHVFVPKVQKRGPGQRPQGRVQVRCPSRHCPGCICLPLMCAVHSRLGVYKLGHA